MTELKPLSPCSGLLPLQIGEVSLSEAAAEPMYLIAPFAGKEGAVSKALAMDWPKPGEIVAQEGVQLVWFGKAQALLIGAAPKATLVRHAAVTDQSDAWARVFLEGNSAREVLARLTPVDLRDAVFAVGQAARTELFHMQASIARLEEERWQIMTFRSMAGTLVHDIKTAMEGVRARERS